jgi:DNA segregation ATPase FtsK/SpoIIIE-like protein
MVGGAALFAISALVYYRINPELEATSFLQHTIVGIYNVFGLAPSVVFFLMVFAWSSIWAVTGILERPLARLGRLLVMALMVAVFLNLRSAGVSSGDHTGAFGSWIAERLVIGIGYVFSLVLVGPAMFASMMLATDWFFSEWFERDRKTTNFQEGEEGVEDGVTDHLRRLSGVASRPESGPTPEAGAATAVDVAVGDDGVDHSEIAAQLQRADAFGTSSVVEDVEAEDADGDAEIVPTRPLSYSGRRLQRAERRIREGEAVEAQTVENIESEAAEAVSVPPPSSGAVMVTEEELESLFDEDAVAAPDQADARATDDGLAEDGLAEDVEASLAVAEDDEDDVDAESEDELEDEFEEGDELEDDEESEDDDELEDEDEESEDDDELEDDEESEDEDEESVDESETEYAEFDGEHEAAEASDVNEDEEVFVTDDGLESEGAISEEESFVTESAASVEEFVAEDLPSAAEPAIAVVDEQIEQEEVVSIPRPDEVPAVALPTPPAVRDSAESFSTRQQKLFGSQVDDDLMVEAVELVNSGRRTTATLLQRKLRIDYELAVEVLSELTTRGLVSDDHDRS